MSEWILIFIVVTGTGQTTTTVIPGFPAAAQCQVAAQALERTKLWDAWSSNRTAAVCVERTTKVTTEKSK